MTDRYDLDALDGAHSSADEQGDADSDDPLGVSVPDEHVGAFVAETFEDAERDTTWEQVVDAMVAPEARDAWESLSPREQVVEVLEMANEYDRRAVARLEEVPLDADTDPGEDLEEARRLRRNADVFRDGVAAAFADGHVDDDDLVAAVEESEFDTDRVARREELLERVANVHGVDFRPYGGTLVGESDRETADPTGEETW